MELEAAITELREAEAAREAPAAELAKLDEQFAAIGRQMQAATTETQKAELVREQQMVLNATTQPTKELSLADARITAARQAVGRAA